MSDDFIPLNQSTPVRNNWFQGENTNLSISGFQNNRSFRGRHRGRSNKRWGNQSQNLPQNQSQNLPQNQSQNQSQNHSQNSIDSNQSYGQEKNKIDFYLHPSMLENPWAKLKKQAEAE